MRFAHCRLGVAFFAAVGLTHPSLAAAAAPPPAPLKVLRHLSFTVGVNVENRTDVKVSGIDGPASGTATNKAVTLGRGTVSVDVVAVTADGGLVVDVSEDTDVRKAAAARVAIVNNMLSYDPKADVTEEESDILRFLSRGFVKPGELSTGTHWTEAAHMAQGTDSSIYTITAVDADAKTIEVAVDETTSVSGPRGFDGTTRGTLTYDTGVLVPLVLTLETRRRTDQVGQTVTTDMKLTSRLTFDSFAKPAAS